MPGNLAAQPDFPSDLSKRAVTVIPEEKVEPDVGDQNIRVTVTIEIGDGHSRPPIWVGQSRSRCQIFESPPAKIPVKIKTSLTRRWKLACDDLAQVVHCGTIHDEQIH